MENKLQIFTETNDLTVLPPIEKVPMIISEQKEKHGDKGLKKIVDIAKVQQIIGSKSSAYWSYVEDEAKFELSRKMKTGPKGIYAHSAEITIQESTRRLWRNSIDIEASREAISLLETGATKKEYKDTVKDIKNKKTREQRQEIRKEMVNSAEVKPTIYNLDIRDLHTKVQPGSIDAIITDPPYPYEFIETYKWLMEFADHALKDGGQVVALAGVTYLNELFKLMEHENFLYRWCIGIYGDNGARVFPRSVANTNGKYCLVYSKKHHPKDRWIMGFIKGDKVDGEKVHKWEQGELLMKKIVEMFCRKGDTIVDPFAGSGTTGVVASQLGVNSILSDIDNSILEKWEN